MNPKVRGTARAKIIDPARAGEDLDPQKARYIRVAEHEVPDRIGDGKDELIALVTTITDHRQAPAPALAAAYSDSRITCPGCPKKIRHAHPDRRRVSGPLADGGLPVNLVAANGPHGGQDERVLNIDKR